MGLAVLLFMCAGAVAGFLAGLFGIGGGMVIVSALLWIFSFLDMQSAYTTHIAVGTSLATIIVTSLSSMRAHHAHGAVVWQVWKHMAIGLVVGSLLGSWVVSHIQSDALQGIIGVGAFLIGLKMLLVKTKGLDENDFSKLPSNTGKVGIGAFIGCVSAIFGIGGGTLTVPILSHYGLKIKHAVGTSAACGFPIAVAGALGFMFFGLVKADMNSAALPTGVIGFVHVYAFLGVSVASFFMAPFGAKAAHKLPAATLKKAFAVLLLLVGLQLVWSAGLFGFTK